MIAFVLVTSLWNKNMNIKVTRFNNKWHARLIIDEIVIDEMACENRMDIGWCCREMMKWADKLGRYSSKYTAAARQRHNLDSQPVGKIYYNVKIG